MRLGVLAVCRRFARQSRIEKRSFRRQNSAPLKLLFPGFLKLQEVVNHALFGHRAEWCCARLRAACKVTSVNPPGPGAFTDVTLHTALNPSRSAHCRWTQTNPHVVTKGYCMRVLVNHHLKPGSFCGAGLFSDCGQLRSEVN